MCNNHFLNKSKPSEDFCDHDVFFLCLNVKCYLKGDTFFCQITLPIKQADVKIDSNQIFEFDIFTTGFDKNIRYNRIRGLNRNTSLYRTFYHYSTCEIHIIAGVTGQTVLPSNYTWVYFDWYYLYISVQKIEIIV